MHACTLTPLPDQNSPFSDIASTSVSQGSGPGWVTSIVDYIGMYIIASGTHKCMYPYFNCMYAIIGLDKLRYFVFKWIDVRSGSHVYYERERQMAVAGRAHMWVAAGTRYRVGDTGAGAYARVPPCAGRRNWTGLRACNPSGRGRRGGPQPMRRGHDQARELPATDARAGRSNGKRREGRHVHRWRLAFEHGPTSSTPSLLASQPRACCSDPQVAATLRWFGVGHRGSPQDWLCGQRQHGTSRLGLVARGRVFGGVAGSRFLRCCGAFV